MENQIKESQKEFYECLERKEEIEFTFKDKHYSIQPKNNNYEIWVENQGKTYVFKTASEALNDKYLDGKSFLEAEENNELIDLILF